MNSQNTKAWGSLILVLALVAMPVLAGPFDEDTTPVKTTTTASQGGGSGVQNVPAGKTEPAVVAPLPTPPAPVPLDPPVGKEISMASPKAKKWFDDAMNTYGDWEFPEGVKNKYGQTVTKEEFFKAIIWIESNGVHRSPHGKVTTSWVGARGFGQLMPNTARGMGIKADDPASNLKGSVKYLKEIFSSKNITKSTGEEKLIKACCAYNMGPYSKLLRNNWDQFKAKAPSETTGYGIKLKMCLGFELTAWEKKKGASLLGAKVKQMGSVADVFYSHTHGLLEK